MVTLAQPIPRFSDDSINLQQWFESRFASFPAQKKALINRACQLARLSGEHQATPLATSCLEEGLKMADILIDLQMDIDSIATAIISISAQFADLSLEDIEEHLGKNVMVLTESFLKMGDIELANNTQRSSMQINNLRKMILAMVSDVRAVLIKLAERICIMRNIKFLKTPKAIAIAQQTHDIYAPLANRLGISQIKWELEDLCFFQLHNDTYKEIAKGLNEKRIDRDSRLDTAKQMIVTMLDNLSINAKVYGRSKHIYSIYQKMQRKHLSLQEIYDASALRIIVNTIDECYAILAQIHTQWSHIPEEFDDYVSNPKPNGYQSIHTVIIGPHDKNIEIQIRTQQMHDEAELGFAAHWVYKEGKRQESSSYEEKISRLRQLLAWHKELARGKINNNEEVFDEVLDDRIYVFTPNGDVIDMPKGATPLDFAYRIHSGVGHCCRGAKINNHIVPLNYVLKTGETVHILTAKNGTPSRDWLNPQQAYVTTSRARAKIQHWFNLQDMEHHQHIGEDLLTREMQRLGCRDVNQKKLAEKLHYNSAQEMIIALGKGTLRVSQVTAALREDEQPNQANLTVTHEDKSRTPSGVLIEGVGNLLTYIANCCKPIYGDEIVGYITMGRGIAIHRKNCANISNASERSPERLVDVNWGQEDNSLFKADLHITAEDEANLLRDITLTLANEKINLLKLNSQVNRKMAEISMTLQLQDLAQLQKITDKLNQHTAVISVHRVG